ncbi:MAG: aminopeptidase P family protein [Bacteroidota bacterium]
MFPTTTYQARRATLLANGPQDGLLVFPTNGESPINCADNVYPYRQDSTFLYYTGIQHPGFLLVMDTATGQTTLYGDDLSLDYIIWMGTQPSVAQRAAQAGIERHASWQAGVKTIQQAVASGTPIHYLPPYRAARTEQLASWLGQSPAQIRAGVSLSLSKAVIAQRSVKTAEELVEMEKAVNITRKMHHAAREHLAPEQLEAAIAGLVEGIAISDGGRLAYPCIATINGHILHNHYHGNRMEAGQLLLLDAGAAARSDYAGDITRTFPVSGTFTAQQRAIYDLVLRAEAESIAALRPGIRYLDIHLQAAHTIATGLTELGLMRGDPAAAVAAGAHALFFPHGLGHMIGLDVHDMEDIGEDLVGYTDELHRSEQFGLRSLRLAKTLEPGYVLTVEPGIYFIPALIDRWVAEGRHTDFINYAALDAYRDFGGIRIEDNVAITEAGYRVLGEPIIK